LQISPVYSGITQDLLSFVDNQQDRKKFRDSISSDQGRDLMKNRRKEILPDGVLHQKINANEGKKGNSKVPYLHLFFFPNLIGVLLKKY
jgi:hypothetical protein